MSKSSFEIYQELIESKGCSENDLDSEIDSKHRELKGFFSREAVIFMIAKENGLSVEDSNDIDNNIYLEDDVDYDEFTINISEIIEDMNQIFLLGVVESVSGIRNFPRKDTSVGTVASFRLIDRTGSIKVTLWDTQCIVIADNFLRRGQVVRVFNGYSKKGLNDDLEVHLGKKGEVVISPTDVPENRAQLLTNLVTGGEEEFKPLEEISVGDRNINVKGKITSIFPIKHFERTDNTTGKVQSMILDDDSFTMKITIWNEDTQKSKDFVIGDSVSIFNLNPKFSDFNNKVELHFNRNSSIVKLSNNEGVKDRVKIKDLYERSGLLYIKVVGYFHKFLDFKELDTKNGKTFLLKFILSDDESSIVVNIWGIKATEYYSFIGPDNKIEISNFSISFSRYSGSKELNMNDNSFLNKLL